MDISSVYIFVMSQAETKPYHHGDLRNALLAEAERLLESEGIQALTLRAVARGAGVSHTAPANHFDDLTGLLSELAADGHLRMDTEITTAAKKAGTDLVKRAAAMGEAYVAFAKKHPGLFTLMYRNERLDRERPALKAALAGKRALARDLLGSPDTSLSPVAAAARDTALWSLVHGYAVLMLDGGLDHTLSALPGPTSKPMSAEDYFLHVVQAVKLT